MGGEEAVACYAAPPGRSRGTCSRTSRTRRRASEQLIEVADTSRPRAVPSGRARGLPGARGGRSCAVDRFACMQGSCAPSTAMQCAVPTLIFFLKVNLYASGLLLGKEQQAGLILEFTYMGWLCTEIFLYHRMDMLWGGPSFGPAWIWFWSNSPSLFGSCNHTRPVASLVHTWVSLIPLSYLLLSASPTKVHVPSSSVFRHAQVFTSDISRLVGITKASDWKKN
jgi:hypothetical protein